MLDAISPELLIFPNKWITIANSIAFLPVGATYFANIFLFNEFWRLMVVKTASNETFLTMLDLRMHRHYHLPVDMPLINLYNSRNLQQIVNMSKVLSYMY